MFFERLIPPIEVDTPDGRGWAVFLRDYGWDFDDAWTVVLADGPKVKQAWTYRNSDIRFLDNATFGVGDARK
jgi:predicted nucleic acid-binding protein